MRLQFWRDALTAAASASASASGPPPPREPIALLLASALDSLRARTGRANPVSKGWLLRLVAAREQSLRNPAFTSLDALEHYAEHTYSTLLYLTLSALPLASVTADHLASHVGKAAGIAAVLRGVPLNAFPPGASAGQSSGGSGRASVTLPLDVLAQAGVREEDVFRYGADAPGLRDAVFAVATRASDHLLTARQMLRNLQAGRDVGHAFEHEGEEGHDHAAAGRPAGSSAGSGALQEVNRGFGVLMPAVPTAMWLDELQRQDFDVFSPRLRTTSWTLPWRAFRAYQTRRL
ncbi:hypothetical protein KEM52_002477 [Ascosphaera acerosa]|nr:hypothetical protein KEM52_002477 [Ascosphaera acerosa]